MRVPRKTGLHAVPWCMRKLFLIPLLVAFTLFGNAAQAAAQRQAGAVFFEEGQAGTALFEWVNLPPAGQAVRAMGDAPHALALASQARVLAVALKDYRGMAWLEPYSGMELGRIALGRMPVAIALNAGGDTAYLLLEGSTQVHVVNLRQRAVVAQWDAGEQPIALALSADGRQLAVADRQQNQLHIFDPAAGAVLHTHRMRDAPLQLAYSQSPAGAVRLLVAVEGGVLVTLDTATWIETSRHALGRDIRALGVADAGGKALALSKRKDVLTIIDPVTGAFINSINFDGDPERLAIDSAGNRVFVTTGHDLSIHRIDMNTGTVQGRHAVQARVGGIVFDSRSRMLLLSHPSGERLIQVDPAQTRLALPLALTQRVTDLAVNNNTDELIILAEKTEQLVRQNLVTRHSDAISLPGAPRRVVVDSGLNRAIVAITHARHEIAFVDLAAATPTLYPEKIDMPGDVQALAVDTARQRTVVLAGGRFVSVLDNDTRSQLGRFSGTDTYVDIAIHPGTGDVYLLTGQGSLQKLNPSTMVLENTWQLNLDGQHLAVDDTHQRLLVSSARGRKVYQFDLATGAISNAAEFAGPPGHIAVHPDNALAVILSIESGGIGTLDLTSNATDLDYTRLDTPHRSAISTRFNQAFVATAGANEVATVELPNPVPVIGLLTPAHVNAGGPALTVTVEGSKFVDGSMVLANGVALTTKWIGAAKLEAIVPATMIATGTVLTMTVKNLPRGGGVSDGADLTVTADPPVLNRIEPAQLLATGQAQTITLYGQHIHAQAAIQVGAQTLRPIADGLGNAVGLIIPGNLLAQSGMLPVTLINPDGTRSATLKLPVVAIALAPAISGISPTQGPVGTQVTITGANLATNAADNQVTFAGDAGNATIRARATIVSASATQLVVTVPANAVTGTVNLGTPGGATVGPAFTVQQDIDVRFTANPINTTVYQGANTNISLNLRNTGVKEYGGLMQLEVSGLPEGVTSRLTPRFLSQGQNGSLLLSAANAAPVTASPVTVILTATDTAGLGITRTATFRINVAAATNVSGIKGRFVTPDGAGIGSVRIAYQDASGNLVSQVQSDSAGTFMLTGLPAGAITLRMDATPAHPLYPIWPYTMNNPGNGLVSLPDWVINPPPADDKFAAISNATQDQAVTDERYPGLAITLPAGVSITGWDGVKKTRLAVERITPDKLPVTAPPFPMKEAYQLYFGTPMGGIPSAPIPITLPNVAEAEPGEQLAIWFFDGSPMGGTGEWKIAGQGVVSADGKTVSTLPGQGITRFCGVCGLFSLACPEPPKPPPCNTCTGNGENPKAGNPVDLLTGQEAPKSVGLSLGGVNSVNVSMSYNPVDAFNGRAGTFASAGLGWTLNYDIVLTPNGTQARVFMPGGRLVDFINTGNNIYKVINDPSFDGAEISPTNLAANLWQIKHRDGRLWKFGPFPGISGLIRGGPPLFVTEMADAQGNVVFITRQANGRVDTVGSSSDRSISLTYGANGFVSGITDSASRSMQLTYNTSKRIETVTDADNRTTRYTYVDDNEIAPDPVCGAQSTRGERIKTILYPGKSSPTENFHGVGKRILRQIAADGRESRFSYHLTGACVTHQSNPGVRCTDASCPTEDNWANHQAGWRVHGGQVFATTVTNADGTSETWRFAADNTPVEHTDAMGQKTVYKYDNFKRQVEKKDPLGRITKYQYDANGNRSLEIDPLQRVTRMTHDIKWNTVTSTTRYNDPTPFGQTNPQVRSMQYDTNTGVLKSATSALNNVTRYEYTAQGLLASVTTPGGAAIRIEYTPHGDIEKMIDALGRDTQFGYDAAGRVIAVTDPLGYGSQTQYSGTGQVTKTTDALGGETRIDYDAAGRPASVTNALNNTIQTNTYDDGDRVRTQANALKQTASNDYDSAGRLISSTDPAGHITTYRYDSAGRLATITHPEGDQSLHYDLVNRVTRIADASGSLEYDYDAADRVTRHTQKSGTRTTTIDYTHDALDRLIRRTIASTDSTGASLAADITEYQYDNEDRITQILYKGNGSRNDLTSYSWDADSRLTQKTLPNGIRVSYQYDLASQLKQIEYTTSANVVLDRIQYTHDANGQIVRRDSLNALGAEETPYTAMHDAANRLTRITLNPGTGNQLSYELTYDANGNLTQKQNLSAPGDTTTFQWDSRNRLTTLNAPGVLASFQYDVLGRRIGKTVNGQTTTYLYDGAQAIGEIQATPNNANSQDIRINLTGLNLDEAIARYTRTLSDNAIPSEQASIYLTDLLGSVIAQSRVDQTIGNRYGYSPYGEVVTEGNDSQNAVQYTARENDNTGLYYYRARYYDPVLKRFVSSDPIGLAGGINTYAYVDGNPISLIDPNGMSGKIPKNYGKNRPMKPMPTAEESKKDAERKVEPGQNLADALKCYFGIKNCEAQEEIAKTRICVMAKCTTTCPDRTFTIDYRTGESVAYNPANATCECMVWGWNPKYQAKALPGLGPPGR
ncbi:MAG: RHS repeat-associated core domain-containing protein [Pseudomonadota bacterium]